MTLRLLPRLAVFALVLAGFACGGDAGRDPSRPPGTPDSGIDSFLPNRDAGVPPMTNQCTKIDFVFVVDDSGSMAEEQGNLATNFPRFIEAVEAFRTDDGFPLDYRIAVTTTGKPFTTTIEFTGFPVPPMTISETGPNGAFLQECGMTKKWLEYGDPDVATTFSCVAEVGTSGSGTEMPLLMMENSVTARVADGMNLGFLREDALLAVVILTDEDDCSRTDDSAMITLDPSMPAGSAADTCDVSNPAVPDISRFVNAMDAVKGDRGRWAVAVIAGPGPGTCSSAFGDALEATRLKGFVTSVGTNAVFSSICEGDLAGALTDALDTFNTACQTFPPLI